MTGFVLFGWFDRSRVAEQGGKVQSGGHGRMSLRSKPSSWLQASVFTEDVNQYGVRRRWLTEECRGID